MKVLSWMALALALIAGNPGARGQEPAGQAPSADGGPMEEVKAIEARFDQARRDFVTTLRAAKSDEERTKLFEEKAPKADAYVAELKAVAEKHPDHPAAARAYSWIVRFGENAADKASALHELTARHLQSPELAGIAPALAYETSPEAEAFLRALAEKNAERKVQGEALMALAQVLTRRAEAIRRWKDGGEDVRERMTKSLGEEAVAALGNADPAPLAAESEKLYERVASEFGDVEGFRGTLGDAAKAQLHELRNLAIGKVAPEITGEDIDGAPMKLSDYRGKVVVLDFWGHW